MKYKKWKFLISRYFHLKDITSTKREASEEDLQEDFQEGTIAEFF
jgi:hypothetical protein